MPSTTGCDRRQPREMPLTKQVTKRVFKAAVIGGGPAGIAVVGRLLDLYRFSKGQGLPGATPQRDFLADDDGAGKILWIDDEFKAGRLSKYRSVPSNTKAKLFQEYGQDFVSFCHLEHALLLKEVGLDASLRGDVIGKQKKPAGWTHIWKDLPLDQGCSLGSAVDMCLAITEALRASTFLTSQQGKVVSLDYSTHSGHWKVTTELSDATCHICFAEQVFLATGAHPNESNALQKVYRTKAFPNAQMIPLDAAFDPKLFRDFLGGPIDDGPPLKVAVVGSSHSAMLVVMNLCSIYEDALKRNIDGSAKKNLRIFHYYRHDLKFAEYREADVTLGKPEPWILYDNTGLKGEVAEWCRFHELDKDPSQRQKNVLPQLVSVSMKFAEGNLDKEMAYIEEGHLGTEMTHFILAIGYLAYQDVKLIHQTRCAGIYALGIGLFGPFIVGPGNRKNERF